MNKSDESQKENESQKKEEATLSDEVKQGIYNSYKKLLDWMRPTPAHPWPLKIILFILKLPVLLLILVLSPVILIILLFVFLTTV